MVEENEMGKDTSKNTCPAAWQAQLMQQSKPKTNVRARKRGCSVNRALWFLWVHTAGLAIFRVITGCFFEGKAT